MPGLFDGRRWGGVSTAVLIGVAAAACAGDATGPQEPDPGAVFTVDASSTEQWALVGLGNPPRLVTASDPGTSSSWDLGFQATGVMLNGGSNGPAGMVAYCVCQNQGATDAQIMAMTPDSESAGFEAVGIGHIPANDLAWSATTFDESRWYRYNLAGNHQVWPTYDVYLVQRGNDIYKIQFIGYYGADGTARQVTFRYALLTD